MKDIMEMVHEAQQLAKNKNETSELFTGMFLDELSKMRAGDAASRLQVNFDVMKSEYVATFRFPVCSNNINVQREFQEDAQPCKTIEVPPKAAECAVLHIKTFYGQCADGRMANTGEPCAKCRHWKTCNFDWRTSMKPLFDIF